MNAVAYMRVSGKGQEEGDGFARQRKAIESHAAGHNLTITNWYQDTQTGKDEWQDRPGWVSMLAGMATTRTIVVEKFDRVARAVLVQELILADLAKKDVRIVSTNGDDTDDQSPERQLFRVILAGFAQYERQSIVLKLRGARQRKKEATGRCEGRKPFGFRPGEDRTLASIQMLRQNGKTLAEIAETLNANDTMPSRTGKPWTAATLSPILKREGN